MEYKMRKSFKRRSSKKTNFEPNHADIQQATQDFLKKGGAIKVVDHVEDYYEDFLSHREPVAPADEFLMGS